jgi:hypothetical protein
MLLLPPERRQRVRHVRQGPDGLLYVLTDEHGAIVSAVLAKDSTFRRAISPERQPDEAPAGSFT